MIRAVIFDLDGTLVQTEKLKALSYGRAVVALCSQNIVERDVMEAFKEVVGRSRQEVGEFLMTRFDLADTARGRMADFGVDTPWEVLLKIRLGVYEAMLADEAMIRSNQWPHNVALLREARAHGCAAALATMSHREQAERVLRILQLEDAFDLVLTRNDVASGKPDPEIYLLAADRLGFAPGQCLVIEDSPAGVSAALAAGAHVLAVSTPFTRDGLRRVDGLRPHHIVDKPDTLPEVVRRAFEEADSAGQWG